MINRLTQLAALMGGTAAMSEDAEAGNYIKTLLKAFKKPQSTKYWNQFKMNELGITDVEFIPGNSGHGKLKLTFKDGRVGEVSNIQSSPGMDHGNAIENTMRDIKNGIKYDKVGADTTNQGNRFQWKDKAAIGAGATGLAGGAQASETPNMDRLGLSRQYDPEKMQGVIDFGKDVVTDPAIAGELIGGGILSTAGAVSPWIKGAGVGLLLDSGEASAAEDPNFMNKLQQQGIL